MIADVVVRSYSKDFRWLRYCFAAFRRNGRGFRDLILIVPERSAPRLAYYGVKPDRLIVCSDYADDYLGQQISKLHADEVTDAEYVVHLDSDCMLRKPCTPDELLDSDGRPVIFLTPNDYFRRGAPWRSVTERFLGKPVEFDYMRRQPLVYPRWLYQELRIFAQGHHGLTLAQYVLSQPPLGFSEFNALGAYAHTFHSAEFSWRLHFDDRYDETLTRVFWSWGGVPAEANKLFAPGHADDAT